MIRRRPSRGFACLLLMAAALLPPAAAPAKAASAPPVERAAPADEEWPPPPPLGLDEVPVPADNPMTRGKAALGAMLFFDKRLSADGTIACASCHMPRRGFSNARQYGIGAGGRIGLRNVPTVLNAAYNRLLFWDGRAESLEAQAQEPILDPAEMASSKETVVGALRALPGYRDAFRKAFGDKKITFGRALKAIATFERTLLSGGSAFDRWKYGGDESALSPAAQRGFGLFRGKARCARCHLVDASNAPFTDGRFHNTGVGSDKSPPHTGREAVTKKPRDGGKFKTPTLRDIGKTAPYMHDGRFERLEEVVAFYEKGGIPNPNLDPDIRPLELTDAERGDLLAFLRSLEGRAPPVEAPRLPR